MPSSRMHRGLVALSASAIAAIYMAGYLRTQSADASIGAAAVALTASPAVATNPLAATPTAIAQVPPIVQRQAPVAARAAPMAQPTSPAVQRIAPQPTAPPASTVSQQAQAALKDGTFTGQGSSRRGDV